MWLSKIKIENIKSIASLDISFSPTINVIVGENNSGKSVIIRSIYLLADDTLRYEDLRLRNITGSIKYNLADCDAKYFNLPLISQSQEIPFNSLLHQPDNHLEVEYHIRHNNKQIHLNKIMHGNPGTPTVSLISLINYRPNNFIYPFFSERKNPIPQEAIQVDENKAKSLNISSENLIANFKIHNGTNFINYCENILGFNIYDYPAPNGTGLFYKVDEEQRINMVKMGSGIPNIVRVLIDLYNAKGQLFLIEELENDIHPAVLKKILDFIVEKSVKESNQFIISTHSNIVLRYLAKESGTNIIRTTMTLDKDSSIPTTAITQISDPEKRPDEIREILRSLGYELADFGLYEGWLILEESSAETIIKYLIKWHANKLDGRIRTISANGVGKVRPAVDDFDRLLVDIHLQQIYKNKAWIVVDGDTKGKETISKLREAYRKSGWDEQHFTTFQKANFEEYYPDKFKDKVEEINNTQDHDEKRKAKDLLIKEVNQWIVDNEEEAKGQFKDSAKEIIEKLKKIESELFEMEAKDI